MTIEQADTIDVATIDNLSGDLWLSISDHLPWDENEGEHLILLQDKLNAYLSFIESGEVLQELPAAAGRAVVINVVGKYPLTPTAAKFLDLARTEIEGAGFRLQFSLMPPN